MSAQNNNSHLSHLLKRTLDKGKNDPSLDDVPSSDSLQQRYFQDQKNDQLSNKAVNQPINQPSNQTPASVKLALFNEALQEVEAQRVSSKQERMQSASSFSELKKPGLDLPPLESSPMSSSRKEAEVSTQSSMEQGASIQVVETERTPELSPEVEKYLQEVHKDQDKAPKEIAIDDVAANLPADKKYVSEPVIVVPITPEIQKKGKRKSPKLSIRWLVEWSQKIMKMFSGKVIYLQPPSDES